MNSVIGVFGGAGFVGSNITRVLVERGYKVRAFVRNRPLQELNAVYEEIGDVTTRSRYDGLFAGIDTMIYTIARTHISGEEGAEFDKVYEAVNCDALINVLNAASQQKVKHFIFLSSIKVMGETAPPSTPFKYDGTPNPAGAYGRSKLKAEMLIREHCSSSELQFTIIRPPLIFGKGVAGNLGAIGKIIQKGLPLPLLSLKDNRRSLVSIENLCSLLVACLENQRAKNKVFLVRDRNNYSTYTIANLMGCLVQKKPFLLPFPASLLRWFFRIISKEQVGRRLTGDLCVDDTDTRQTLGWDPSR